MKLPQKAWPRDGNGLDKVEWALEWVMGKLIVHSDRYPLLSSMATGVTLSLFVGAVITLLACVRWALTGHWIW